VALLACPDFTGVQLDAMALRLFIAVFLTCWSASAGKTTPMSSKEAAENFNRVFTGHASAKGVYMRATEDMNLHCPGACFKGYPECTMSAMFWNHIAGVDKDGHLHSRIVMAPHQAGVVFNSALVESTLARCYYATNGVSRTRYNGGCGCQAPEEARGDCKSPHCPYENIGPDGYFVDGDVPQATKCMCKDYRKVVPNDACFWRGPAYNTSAKTSMFGKKKAGRFESSEVDSFIKQREVFQTQFKVAKSVWDEVVIDGHGLKEALDHDPANAVEGVYYYTPQDLAAATKVQADFKSRYGVVLPIVRVDDENPVSKDKGPFVEHKGLSLDTASVGLSEEPLVV